MSTLDFHSRNSLVAAWLGVLVCALGAIVIAGWHLRAPLFVQLNPSWAPMQYNTALSFIALGLGVLAMTVSLRWVVAVLAGIPIVIGSITLLTWVLDLHLGIDEMFFRHYITVFTPIPGRMSPLAAFCFVLAGVALLIDAIRPRRAQAEIAWTIGLVIVTCGVLASTWSLLQSTESPGEPVRFTYLAVHTGIGFILSGAAITISTVADRSALPKIDRVWEPSVAAGLATAVISLLFWQAFTVAEDRRIRSGTHDALEQIAAALEADSRSCWEVFAWAAQCSTAREAMTAPDRVCDEAAHDYFRGNGWLQEIVWFDGGGSIRYRILRDPGISLPDPTQIINRPTRAVFRKAQATSTVQLLRIDDPLVSGRLGYFLAPSASGSDRNDFGVLAFTARLDELFSEAIGQTAWGYDVEILDADRPVFTRSEQEIDLSQGSFDIGRREIEVYGHRWMLEVAPGPELLRRLATLLPQLTLLFGLALSLLIAVALRYAGMVKQRTASIIDAQALLEREVEERRRAEVYARASEERARFALAEMQQILNQSQDLICTFDVSGRFLVVSASAWQILGYRPDEMSSRDWKDFVYTPDHEDTARETAELREGKVTRDFENRFIHRNGSLVHLSWSAAWLPGAQTCYAIARDVTKRNRQEALREGQRQVLQRIATGAPLEITLNEICACVESIDRSAYCSILTLDADGTRIHTAAAPRLPSGYTKAIEGMEIGPAAGSCGTALWRKQIVIVEDIHTDPLWADCAVLAKEHGLRACWSIPVMGNNRALGSFAIYHCEPRRPQPYEIEMMEAAAGLAAIAIEREQAQARLVESREQLEFARKLAQLGYWEVYLDTGRTVLSADMLRMLGLNEAFEHGFNTILEFILKEDRAALLATRDAAIAGDTPIDIETRVLLPDGSLRYLHLRGRTVRRHDRWVVKLAGTVQDITARKQVELENARLYAELEQRVQSRTRELEQSNRELEAFSYSVSHDLRAPLRAIAGFSALLQEHRGQELDTQGRHYLNRIIAGTARMSALIDDLLELGRVSRVELVRQPLDLSSMAAVVAGRLLERWPDREVDIEIQPNLTDRGDARLVEIVLENLLDNAWKFTAGRTPAKVRVGRDIRHGQEVFFVADNGVGFDPKYANNLFGVFQRLHAASAFPGTGVGLATVQRILQRHGGRIWAEALVDEGATFYFVLSETAQ